MVSHTPRCLPPFAGRSLFNILNQPRSVGFLMVMCGLQLKVLLKASYDVLETKIGKRRLLCQFQMLL